ncbi:MAG: J domain-containing protein, partial [Hyphomicrobiales bacterium]|nr:J domain-containing protein [Hyphomicrobiales bacterium]
MPGDPYETLGVKKDASADDIQKAYRGLAKKLHPDLNPGNKKSEEEFKEVSAAYGLLSDPEKRGRFDRGEIDASGQERPQQRYYRDFADSGASRTYSSEAGYADFADEDLFADLFGGRGRANLRMRGADAHYQLEVDFLDAVNGAKRQITLPEGAALEVTIPAGTHEGQVLRLRGKGRPGIGGGAPGDALIEIAVRPHPQFTRKDDDIHVELAIPLDQAVLGGRISVPTPTGPVTMTVPKWSNSGAVLRLKGKGVARRGGAHGDEYVTLKVML